MRSARREPRAQQRDLTVVSWGGAYQDAQREVYFRPWMAVGEPADAGGNLGRRRRRAARAHGLSGANTWDVVQVEFEELLIGCEEGLFERLDFAAIGGREDYIPQAVSECGVGAILDPFVMA